MDKHLSIRIRREHVPLLLKLRPKSLKIIYLTIEDSNNTPVLIIYRLRPALKVNDTKPPEPERDPVADELSG